MNEVVKSTAELQAELGQALRALRINRQLTQENLAVKAGVSLRSLANLERNGGATLQTLVRALNAMGAAGTISQLVPQPQISPLAMLRHETGRPQRVRRRSGAA
ncbi:MAG: transcriptional regulator, family [Verrucomicrobia bacterium]|nr:transcriptional regulator, family [Verrucomicrobiota bacterium]